MKSFTNAVMTRWSGLLAAPILMSLGFSLVSCGGLQHTVTANDSNSQTTFATPEDAGQSLQAASRARDENALASILGPKSKAILHSGDPDEDARALDSFVAKYDRMNRWVSMTDGKRFLYIGADNYAFPIPLVQNASSKWYFDTEAGEDEVLIRRVGRNELLAIDACKAFARAEELFRQTSDAAGQYTPFIISSPGKRNGLYWGVAEGQNASPLGNLNDFAKEAIASGSNGEPVIFDGYYFRILTEQGDGVQGGARNYLVDGKMTGGFAVMASPVKYRDSGIMTFILGREGVVYQKDLGARTSEIAQSIKSYNQKPERNPAE